MAVGGRLGDRRAAEIAARARTVFDDELLAEIFAQRVRATARARVSTAAPAGNGTTMVTGRFGHSCATAR